MEILTVFSFTLNKLCALPERMCSHITIPGEDVDAFVIHPYWECKSSPGMGI